MKVGALVLGIIGGLVALLYGVFGYGLGSLTGDGGAKFLSIGLPIAALVGAGMVTAKPVIGATLMAIAAMGFVLILGFNFFSLIPVVLLGLGALLGFLGSQESTEKSHQNNSISKNPSVNSTPDTKECPFCAETVKRAAKVCRYCSKDLPEILEPVQKIISPPVAQNEVATQPPITNYDAQPEESQQSHEKTATEQLSPSVPARKSNTFAYGACFVFLIVAVIGVTYFYKTKVDSDKLSNLKENGDATAPAGNQTVNALASTKKVNKDVPAYKYCGTWEYDRYGSKSYFKITDVGNGKFKFSPGYKYENSILWNEPMLKNANGIYLKYVNGKLNGKFISGNFYATHGQDFTYKITLALKSDDKVTYSVNSSIRNETDVSEATKIQ